PARYAEEAVKPPPEPARPRPLAEAPAIDLSAEAVGLFATRVQPILMNACARCHLAEGAGAFQLERTASDGVVNRKAMQQNLTAVVAQLNLRLLEASPLLIKAVSAHGPTGEAPLRGRHTEAESEFDPDLFNRQMHPHGKPPTQPVKP